MPAVEETEDEVEDAFRNLILPLSNLERGDLTRGAWLPIDHHKNEDDMRSNIIEKQTADLAIVDAAIAHHAKVTGGNDPVVAVVFDPETGVAEVKGDTGPAARYRLTFTSVDGE